MPELPDVTIYVEALRERLVGRTLRRCRIAGPFLLRTFQPPAEAAIGRRVRAVGRIGKRVVLSFDDALFYVFHLMIAGRFRWEEGARTETERRPANARASTGRAVQGPLTTGKIGLAAFEFDSGTLHLTEAATKKRAALHVVAGEDALTQFNAGGLDLFSCDESTFAAVLQRENHTLKRTLTDPRLIDGVGNAYSDEILHAARLSPVKLSRSLTAEETARLLAAARETLLYWTERLRRDFAGRFPGPGEITAFRPDFAVHGKFGRPCPACGTTVQRIVYAENETNYCPTCQTGGKLLADRSLSRLLREDWPRTVEALEQGFLGGPQSDSAAHES